MTSNQEMVDGELTRHHCSERVDLVSGDAETTAFRQRARLQQAVWRERRSVQHQDQ